jgi:hypothetical protein
MKSILLIAFATLCFGASEPILSLASLKAVEASINDRVSSSINDPYDLMGPARGTYLEGYGAVFTVYIDLVPASPLNLSPFKPAPTEKELTELHNHKARKVPVLKEAMRDLMANACKTLPALPPEERIVMEAFLFNYNWEQSRGLPHRIVLTARKQKLLDAVAHHASPAEFAALFQEEEL